MWRLHRVDHFAGHSRGIHTIVGNDNEATETDVQCAPKSVLQERARWWLFGGGYSIDEQGETVRRSSCTAQYNIRSRFYNMLRRDPSTRGTMLLFPSLRIPNAGPAESVPFAQGKEPL
ncbi:hypothetical protein CERSUDRAFT_84151 [Gelatoporia subvermispora B]|uniref:Uncharacterized protein n=1 Tax=Ceriporiopsis subvermispora (strain B) TaxID=914234 RepID=M2QY85_CERS8|nr:hypothetical protein CERSUDRAFT_84151 [Gelatoporia subvermispora B]